MPFDHFYTRDSQGEVAWANGYEMEGVLGYLYATGGAGRVALNRWYSRTSGDHFYTVDPNGEIAEASGYRSEGVAGYLPTSHVAGTIAIHRWFHPQKRDHLYTSDPAEQPGPAGYVYEGQEGWIFESQAAGTLPFYRWYQSGIGLNYTFAVGITQSQRDTILRRHSVGQYRCRTCGNLSEAERNALRAAYKKAIIHGIDTDPNNNASAIVGGRNIWVNFSNLFPLGDQEIAQTLIHEVMHLAGYTHPTRRDPPLSNPDIPGDNGPYYGSPPLRAELCIAGVQSDAGRTTLWVQRMEEGVTDVPVKPGH